MKNNKVTENKSKYALITGATSGIGYELAKLVVQDGYNAILVSRNLEQLNEVKKKLSQYNVEVSVIAKDLFEKNAAEEIFNEIKSKGISISLLINDAGQGEYGKFIETDLNRQLDIIQLNINSLVALTYYFLKDMVARDEGRILQLGSEVSKVPSPYLSVYAATKAFVLSFTEALINEIKDTNVTMTLLMPGATDTDFFDKAGAEDTKTYREGKLESPEEVARTAYDAWMKGERRIVASNAKRNVGMASVMPDHVNAAKLRKSMEPSEKDSSETRQEPDHAQSRKQ